jgi:hypothetical protein
VSNTIDICSPQYGHAKKNSIPARINDLAEPTTGEYKMNIQVVIDAAMVNETAGPPKVIAKCFWLANRDAGR